MKKPFRIAGAATAVLLAAAMLLTGCSSGGTGGTGGTSSGRAEPPEGKMPTSLGAGEGQLNLIAWAGYAEDGSNDPTVDWVHPFQEKTGCQVHTTYGATSDDMIQLMRTGQYDGVSASGDATLRLIYAGDVAPVNTKLVPNYETISSFLKNGSWNSVNGQSYGIPHGWGANLLMYTLSAVSPAPTSWSAVFDDAGAY
jgi:putative spermidine/putrescine transport system substrate-binding protein